MRLYLDTSCLAKLFIQEADSSAVKALLDKAQTTWTSWVSYVEMKSVLARHAREKLITPTQLRDVQAAFEADWMEYSRIRISDRIVQEAARLIGKHPLRSLDAIHLASALFVRDLIGEAPVILTTDKRLLEAAKSEHLPTHS